MQEMEILSTDCYPDPSYISLRSTSSKMEQDMLVYIHMQMLFILMLNTFLDALSKCT